MSNTFTDWTSRVAIAAHAAEERRRPESWNEMSNSGRLRPAPREDRVPDKAREVALAGLYHLIAKWASRSLWCGFSSGQFRWRFRRPVLRSPKVDIHEMTSAKKKDRLAAVSSTYA